MHYVPVLNDFVELAPFFLTQKLIFVASQTPLCAIPGRLFDPIVIIIFFFFCFHILFLLDISMLVVVVVFITNFEWTTALESSENNNKRAVIHNRYTIYTPPKLWPPDSFMENGGALAMWKCNR